MYDKKFETVITTWFLVVSWLAILAVVLFTAKMETPNKLDIPTEYTHTVYLVVKDEAEPEKDPSVDETPSGPVYTEEEIDLIATLVMAEAGNQSELGKRLVIDVVLNRVEHPNFPDTVYDVIYQENQFSPATSGTINLYSATEEHIRLVREEIDRRTDHDVVFFRADHYGRYGVPMYCIGDHYFSSYS